MREYPDSLYRGITNKDFILEGGTPSFQLFNKFEDNPERNDEFKEISINWNDECEALKLLLDDKKSDGSFHYRVGVAKILTNDLRRVCNAPQVKGCLDYERRELPNNKYHGNILLKKNTPNKKRNQITSMIALYVDQVHYRE